MEEEVKEVQEKVIVSGDNQCVGEKPRCPSGSYARCVKGEWVCEDIAVND